MYTFEKEYNLMKQHLEELILAALNTLQAQGEFSLSSIPPLQIDTTKDKQHGDFATNIALVLAKPLQRKPREIAEKIVHALPVSPNVAKVEIAGPGFINFFSSMQALSDVVPAILAAQDKFGHCQLGQSKRVHIEFVSANTTGPLHVGHGRHAAYGDTVGNLLKAVGFSVHKEYYVNDAGRQMDILAASVWLRYLTLCGETIIFPTNAYRGGYVVDIAKVLHAQQDKRLHMAAAVVFKDLPRDEPEGGDKEEYINALIIRAQQLLGDGYKVVFDCGLHAIQQDIHDDLVELGVVFDTWFSERDFIKTDVVNNLIATWKQQGYVYEREGAYWFRSTDFGDEKDRVIERSNGQRTYFANDAAYHIDKFHRGFDKEVWIVGADHHGYVPRVRAALQAGGIDVNNFSAQLVQFVTLYRGKEQVQMSTRGGEFVTLRELRAEVGNDAARFFYVMRKCEQHMDFDLDLAKSQSNDNPIYYIQYAHARICSVFRQLAERGGQYDQTIGLAHLHLLTESYERQLLTRLGHYPQVIANAALQYEPHLLTHYLRDLATDFHAYYNSHQFLTDDIGLRYARLALITATRQILINGLKLIGVQAPDSM